MIVLPAIDIKNGKCVRLRQGLKDDETVYADSPVEMARHFSDLGADYIHIIDLDGAFEGRPKNLEIIREISQEIDTPIEIGGGIRTREIADDYIDAGVSRIIIGTKAVEDLNFVKELIDAYGDKVAVSLDCKGNKVCTNGWVDESELDVFDLAKELQDIGLSTLVYTDISKDGMLTGPNFEMLKALNDTLDLNIIASGGMADESHLDQCAEMDLYGAITGKAIYENTIDLESYLKKQRGQNAG